MLGIEIAFVFFLFVKLNRVLVSCVKAVGRIYLDLFELWSVTWIEALE